MLPGTASLPRLVSTTFASRNLPASSFRGGVRSGQRRNPGSRTAAIRREQEWQHRAARGYLERPKAFRTTALRKIDDTYDYSGLEYPASLEGIAHFEKLNNVCVYVYEIDEDTDDIIDCKRVTRDILKM